MLTSQQLATLKADILADPILAAKPNNSDGNSDIAAAYNLPASPNYTVWKTLVQIAATGQSFNGTELAGLTTANQTRLQTIAMYFADGYNAALADVRQMFNDIWSGAGGQITRVNLAVLWKRFATRVEKLFATGAGSDASPAVLTFEGQLTYQDVEQARNS